MSGVYDDWIIQAYKIVKDFPKNSKLINPTKKGVLNINEPNPNTFILIYFVLVLIALLLFVMLIASVINYEVMFRDKAINATQNGTSVDYYAEYYSKPENINARYFYAPLLSIMLLILLLVIIRYIISK